MIIREKDAEEVITLMARFISLGRAKKTDRDINTNVVRTEKGIVRRKKVYADTSSGGWY